MITLPQFLNIVKHRITDSDPYQWDCYGSNARILDSWDGRQDGVSACIIFDTKNQTVYEATVCDMKKGRAYRIINPAYVSKHNNEAADKNIDHSVAWDDVKWIDLEVDDDFIEKLTALVEGKPYDDRIQVPLTLDDKDLFTLMKMAHENDITLNEMVEHLLKVTMQSYGYPINSPI